MKINLIVTFGQREMGEKGVLKKGSSHYFQAPNLEEFLLPLYVE